MSSNLAKSGQSGEIVGGSKSEYTSPKGSVKASRVEQEYSNGTYTDTQVDP